MPPSVISRPEELLAELVHDLRQPLGNIETSVYLLKLVTPPDLIRAHTQLRAIERQVNDAACLLSKARSALACLCREGAGGQGVEAKSFDLTNPATAAVT